MARKNTRKPKVEDVEKVETEVVETNIEESKEEVKSNNESKDANKPRKEVKKDKPKKVVEPKPKNVTIESLLEEASNDSELVSDSSIYKRYYDATKGRHNPEDGISHIYNLHSVIRSILKESNYTKFKKRFDLLNKLVLIGNKNRDPFSIVGLSRYDYLWKKDMTSYDVYYSLAGLIGTLCDRNQLSKNLKSVSLEKFKSTLTKQELDNLMKYYDME